MNVGTVKVHGIGWSPGREAAPGPAPRRLEEAAARGPGQDAEAAANADLERAALDTLNARLAPKDLEARFSRDEKTDRLVVKVVSRSDGAVVWQIPNEKALAVAAAQQQEAGRFVNKHV